MVAVSDAYRKISQEEAEAMPMIDAWKDPSIPSQQQSLTKKELEAWLSGHPVAPFDVMRECLRGLPKIDVVEGLGQPSVLEVGCGVGHYKTVIESCGDFAYFGVDYSRMAIDIANNLNPARSQFYIMDALNLDFQDRSFTIVISGCVLLHIVDWRRALKEAARVSSRYLILHRTPVSDEPTRYFFKKAYGVETVEIHFNKAEMIAETESHGFNHKQDFPVTTGQETLLFERSLFHHPV